MHSQKNMTALFDTRYYRVTKLFASLVGLWPYQSQFRRTITQSLSMFILFTFFPPQVKRLYDAWGHDLDVVCTGIAPIVTVLASMVKILTSAIFQSKIEMLLRQIEMDWEINPTQEEYKILVKYTLKTRKLCIVYSTMMCNGLICFILTPTIQPILDIILPHNETRMKNLAFELDYGIDLQTHWLWLWLHTSTTSSATVLNIIGADLTYVMLILHVCYLFVLVRHKLELIAGTIKQPFENSTMQPFKNHNYNLKYAYEDKHEEWKLQLKNVAIIRECVINHQKAIECVQILQRIYRWSFLVMLGLNLVLMSFSAVQLVSRLSQWQGMMMSFMFIIGQLTHLFFLSLMAQFILDQSSNVYESTYACLWYTMPLHSRRDIILILIRSRIPCKIMAGKLFVMSLENFSSIVQSAVSYFTVLVSFR